MEFEVRAVGGIETCFVSLPLSLIQTLQSGHLPPILAIELRAGARIWHVGWCGSASSSASSIEIAGKYADCIGLSDGTVVRVRVVGNLPKATMVTIEPLTEDDWEILELNSDLAESSILKQVGIVHEEMKFPLWLHGQTVVMFLVVSVFPQKPVAQLVPGTEVAVAPKRRKQTSLNPEEVGTIAKAQLRVQDSDCGFTYKFEDNGIDMDILFTAGALIHPETAKKYSFSSLQFVVISPKDSRGNLQSKISTTGTEDRSGYLSGKQVSGKLVICLLFSESVAKGHIKLSQSLRLYLGAGVHSWVHVKGYNVSKKKNIVHASVSPYHFKMFAKDVFQNSSPETKPNHENHKRRDVLQDNSSNSEWGSSDWSMHEKLFAALSSGSSHGKAGGTTVPNEETHTKVRYTDSLSSLLCTWFEAQIKTFVSNSAEGINTVNLGSKTIIHLKVKKPRFYRYGKKTSSEIYPRYRKQSEESAVDFLYILSLSEESLHDDDSSAYELAFDECSGDKYASRRLDSLLGELQLGDILFSHASYEAPTHDAFSSQISSLDWMGNAPVDINYRLATLLSRTSGILLSKYNLPLPGHILIYGPPGCGKTLLAKVSAKYVEENRDILAHVVFVSCSRLSLQKPQAVRQALSGYISEALDCAPSVIIFDDLDTLIAPVSDVEGSQPSLSSVALVEFLADIVDEYAESSRSLCGMGPIAFIATAQSFTSLPQSLISSGRFDFHINLPIPAVAERFALLKHEIQKRSLQCSDDLVSDIASKCDGYDAYDLEILVDRTVHAAIGHSLSADLGSGENEKPTLVRENFLQAMQNFLPVTMRDMTKPAADANRSGWEDVGGLNDIQNAIKEMIELPSKFRNIFAHAPLRMRSNVLLYGPPGCGKTHIVGAAAAACSLRFISVKGPELLNKYIGASEQAVRDIFSKAAAAAPCLLFFDEFDSIAPKRGHDNTGVTDRVVNQFLTELDGVEVLMGVFVFAATSRPDLLDAALLRPGRLDRLLFCDFPSPQERLEILEVLSRKLPLANDVDLEGIAHVTEGFSGADLQALLSDTQLEAVHELLDSENGSATGKMPVITNALLKSIASKAKPSVSQAEKRRLYDIYSQFLDSKRSLSSQSRDAKGKRATLA